jgi:hypothetical protein
MPPRVQPYASSSSLLQPVAGPSTSNARQIANVNAQVAANSLNDQHDIVSVIEIQDALDAMPLELTKCFGDLRELDAVLNGEPETLLLGLFGGRFLYSTAPLTEDRPG